MYPHERSLVKQLAGKPFEIVGVNSDRDLEAIRKICEQKNISWRSFQNESSTGTISDKWGIQGWPTIFLIDAKGVIRYQGHSVSDELIEELLAEMGHELEIGFDDPGEKEVEKPKESDGDKSEDKKSNSKDSKSTTKNKSDK